MENAEFAVKDLALGRILSYICNTVYEGVVPRESAMARLGSGKAGTRILHIW